MIQTAGDPLQKGWKALHKVRNLLQLEREMIQTAGDPLQKGWKALHKVRNPLQIKI
ncbi:hypothetical protein [Lysinibacillus irui]|uniref:Uncharacterized protein n=1 Tax=Lysinibacillus irui TaxID=2998077 RepID=A0AAJ5RS46_9BACI|nr:hypothetical protein [Lysinibacillus irui]WDV08579.1 hypothetical protein OU989_08890 [Lysinibacillus irui]